MLRWGFVGRADELNRLVAAATGGTGRGLILSGTAGIGKSRLLRQAIDGLPPDRYAVWSAAANIATSGLPFGGLAQVLPTDRPVGLAPTGFLRWAVDTLARQAAGRTMVLAIDDAHLLDRSSAALVYLLARSARTTVLGTLRRGHTVPHPIRALWTEDLVDHADLAEMNPADGAALLAAMLGDQVDPVSAERLWRLAAGNALLLRELVIAAQNGGELHRSYGVWRWTGRLELARSLEDLIDSRLGQLSPGVRAVVEMVALGEPIGLALLNQATDARDVEAAEERGLIGIELDDRRTNVRLAHPLYGEVVRRNCPVTRTRRIRATLADLLERSGGRRHDDLLRTAVWRLDSGTAQEPELLLTGCRQAFGRFDVPLATRLADAALESGGGFDAAELLATILMFADQPEEAIRVLDRVADQIDCDQRRGRWLTVRGMVSYWGLSQESIVREISEAGGRLRDPAGRARVDAFEAIMRLHRLDTAEALRLSRTVLDRPAATVAARSLARCAIAHLQAARGESRLSARTIAGVEADAAHWRDDMPYLRLALELARGTQLTLAGDLAGIDTIVAAEFADLADAGDFRLGSGYLSILRAQAARLRGRSGEASRTSLGACAVLATSRVYAGLAHAERAQAAALRGETDQAIEAMAESDRSHPPGMAVLYPWLEQARAAVLAATGDTAGAAEVLHALAARLAADGLAGHEVLALHDLVRLGRTDDPVRIPGDGPSRWVADPGGPGGTSSGPTGGERRQTVAQRLCGLAETVQGRLAPLFARHGRADAARSGDDLLAVSDAFADLELNVYAAEAATKAVTRLREVGSDRAQQGTIRLAELLRRCDVVRTPALASHRPALTARERQIAGLAARGLASRDIAEQLYISTRTVENHLQRVYSKLGVAGRGELCLTLPVIPERKERE
jgi:DNA-binding CsgD family transcriptional regulator